MALLKESILNSIVIKPVSKAIELEFTNIIKNNVTNAIESSVLWNICLHKEDKVRLTELVGVETTKKILANL